MLSSEQYAVALGSATGNLAFSGRMVEALAGPHKNQATTRRLLKSINRKPTLKQERNAATAM
jgi:hypothetical protein